jgi:transglutaminase-like putative cysteine protease
LTRTLFKGEPQSKPRKAVSCCWKKVLVIFVLLPWSTLGQLSVSTLKTNAPSAWVVPVAPEAKTALKSEKDGGGQLLTLMDTQVNAPKAETFVHIVKDITSQMGVQSGANLEFRWDPSYEELIIHEISIQRSAERINMLDPTKFKVIQQESDLNLHVYNGALSALRFLEDVRVGDRIEYAYTLRGENPSLKGRYSDRFIAGLGVPIKHRRIRLLWPEQRGLDYRCHGISVKPEVYSHGGVKEYIFELRDVPGVVLEDQSPSWVPAYPWIQVSEFESWPEVATWASKLFLTTNLAAPELKQEIANLRRPGATSQQTVQGALDFVQNNIRYLGIEFGPNSYRPTDPVTVLRRRFGDCKDKAFLLCTLLQGLGYDATPTLVATGLRHRLPDLLPAPHDFDHVIVRVVVENATYWVDPTRAHQRGPIAQRYLPNYSFGLLVRPGEAGLTRILPSAGVEPETLTREIFHLGGQKAPAQLEVTSTFKGFDAEWMRAYLSAEGPERSAKSYLNDYAQRYAGIMVSKPMVIEDSPDSDTLTLRHSYSITNFWVLGTDKQHYNCQFYPQGIRNWITKPSTAVRSMPMELSFPRRRCVQTRIELPRPFKLSNLTNTIAGPAAQLRVQRAYRGQTVWLDYEYKALTNFVPVSLTGQHLNSLDAMENALGYTLTWQNLDAIHNVSQFNWPIFLIATVYAALLCTGAVFLYRDQHGAILALASQQTAAAEPELRGLGGWLILVGIGLVCGPLRVVGGMTRSFGAFALWKWQELTTVGGMAYHPGWGPLLTIELLGQITVLILNLLTLVFFLQKLRSFPRLFIVLMVVNAIIVVGDHFGLQAIKPSASSLQASARSLMQVLIGCAIWIPYMCVSRRVKATFIEPCDVPVPSVVTEGSRSVEPQRV